MIRRHHFVLCLPLIFLLGSCTLQPKQLFKLDISEDNVLTWERMTNKYGKYTDFTIEKDGALLASTKLLSYGINTSQLTDAAPPDVPEIREIVYDRNEINVKWSLVRDNGTLNKFTVFLNDEKGRKSLKSNEAVKEYSSGLSSFMINEDTNEIKSAETKLERSKLPIGEYTLKISSIDKAGNRSQPLSVDVYNYMLEATDGGGEISLMTNDSNQEYRFYKVNSDGSREEISSHEQKKNFKDKTAPIPVKNIGYSVESSNIVRLHWEKSNDVDSDDTFYFVGVGQTYGNEAFSKDIKVNTKTGLKGYYFSVDQKSDYTVTSSDSFTEMPNTVRELKEGTYYLHVAAADNSNNLSNTVTAVIKVKSQYKASLARKLLMRDSKTTDTEFSKVSEMLCRLTSKVLNRFTEKNLKIYIADGEAESIYKKFTGKNLSGVAGIFFFTEAGPTIVFEKKNIDLSFYHEVGHAVDYCMLPVGYITDSSDFKAIFNEEKNKLFPGNSTYEEYAHDNEKEYFGEAFRAYMADKLRVKNSAPKTSEVIEKAVN